MHFQNLLEDGAVIAGTSLAAVVFTAAAGFAVVVPSPVQPLINDPDRLAAYTEYCKNLYTGQKILVTDEAGVVREAIPVVEGQDCLNGLQQRDEAVFNQSRIASAIFLGSLAAVAGAGALSGMRGKHESEGWHPLVPATW